MQDQAEARSACGGPAPPGGQHEGALTGSSGRPRGGACCGQG